MGVSYAINLDCGNTVGIIRRQGHNHVGNRMVGGGGGVRYSLLYRIGNNCKYNCVEILTYYVV